MHRVYVDTRSSAVAERPRDASALGFNVFHAEVAVKKVKSKGGGFI